MLTTQTPAGDVPGGDELNPAEKPDNLCPVLPALFPVRCLVMESSPALKWRWMQAPGRCKAFLGRQCATELTLHIHHVQLLWVGVGFLSSSLSTHTHIPKWDQDFLLFSSSVEMETVWAYKPASLVPSSASSRVQHQLPREAADAKATENDPTIQGTRSSHRPSHHVRPKTPFPS